ncbi:ClbS/DfsB family four-helix bundle protein [Candidatus Leptofilum sp.]|uniref:ClbS/DfsB family four-helix bundle protein n=1 Tax=Candidatus Leptofilum sp. TaxID=3241576 RepID=UPI003B5CC47A
MSDTTNQPTKSEFITRMNDGLTKFSAFLNQFSAEQLMEPTDTVGWNARDHIVHMAVWADGIAALLSRKDRWDAMGISAELGESGDFDRINEAIAVQHRHLSAVEARSWLLAAHERLVTAMEPLDNAGLQLPYERFVPPFSGDGGSPVLSYIIGDSYEHYQEHMPWIEAIIRGA